jgi:hypothetical protein
MGENKTNIPFSPPDVGEEEIKEVSEALRSGWITTGPRVKELERRIAAWVGTARCVCLNSQTACAELALHLLGIGAGDEHMGCDAEGKAIKVFCAQEVLQRFVICAAGKQTAVVLFCFFAHFIHGGQKQVEPGHMKCLG